MNIRCASFCAPEETITAPPSRATASTLAATPASTRQGSTTAPSSVATPTALEATSIDQSSTTTRSTKQATPAIRYLEPTFQVDVQRDVLYGTAPMPDGSDGLVDGSVPLDGPEQAQIDRARNDLQAAVRWFKANAAVLDIDPDRIGLGGYSAGAIMSAGATARWNDPAIGSNPEFSAAMCGAMSIAGALNPAFVDPGDAGVIFHHGTLDTTVPFAAAVAARDAMLDAGLPIEWHEYPGEGHGFSTASQAAIATTSIQWLYEHVATAPYPCSAAVAAGVPES